MPLRSKRFALPMCAQLCFKLMLNKFVVFSCRGLTYGYMKPGDKVLICCVSANIKWICDFLSQLQEVRKRK